MPESDSRDAISDGADTGHGIRTRLRNGVLRVLGLRWTESVTELRDDGGTVFKSVFESRPWWERDREMHRQAVDELDRDDVQSLNDLFSHRENPDTERENDA